MPALVVEAHQTAPMPLAASFSCEAGELLALVGPSGSGKTSLLRSIAGLMQPAKGRIEVGGHVWFDSTRGVNLPTQQRRVGLVFQSYALFPHLTAMENVAIASADADPRAMARALLKKMKLEGLEMRRPAQLSGGQQQRVALARALARDPAVLLLDEPFSAVDQVTRQALYRELAELRQSLAIPIVLVTHDLYEARMLADSMVILSRGESLQQGPPQTVVAKPRNARVASLVGIHNHFRGIFHSAAGDDSFGELAWGEAGDGPKLKVVDKRRIDNGQAVTWVIAGEYLSLAQFGELGENTVAGTLIEALPMGEVTHCKLRMTSPPHDTLVINAPTQLLRDNNIKIADALQATLDWQGIHVMPTRAT